MSETGIEKFDPSTLMQGVKDQIKATFVSLIPEAQWIGLVEKEVDAFFNQTTKLNVGEKKERVGSAWYETTFLVVETEQSPFRSIVWQYCKDMTYQVLKEKINKDFFNSQWSPEEKDLSEAMKEMIQSAAPAAMASFFQQILFNQGFHFRQQIENMKSGY